MSAHEERIRNWMQNGAGRGPEYRPWITVRTSSSGQVNRVYSRAARRTCHLQSKREFHAFLLLDYAPNVIDIREQYPLLPVHVTRGIAAELRIVHSRPAKTHAQPRVMTTDFYVTLRTPTGVEEHLLFVTTLKKFRNPRTLRRFAVEREFWARLGLPLQVVTEREMPPTLVGNLAWLHPFAFPPIPGIQEPFDRSWADPLLEYLRTNSLPLDRCCGEFDRRAGLERGHSLALARRLLAERAWEADLRLSRLPSNPIVGLRRGRGFASGAEAR